MTPGTTYLSLNSLPFMILLLILSSSFVLFSCFFSFVSHIISQSPTAKFGVASVVGVDTLEAASTSPHVGGPWVTAVASSMRAVPSLVSALGRQSSSF